MTNVRCETVFKIPTEMIAIHRQVENWNKKKKGNKKGKIKFERTSVRNDKNSDCEMSN